MKTIGYVEWGMTLIVLTGACTAAQAEPRPTSDRVALHTMIQTRLERNPAWQRAQQDPPFSGEAPSGFVTDEVEKQRQRAAATMMWKDLQAAVASGRPSFVIPPGEYRFADNQGLTISGWKDVHLQAEGACFWFERSADQLAADPRGLVLRGCRQVRISGLTIDFDPPVYIQAEIESIVPKTGEVMARIDPDWPKASVGAGQFSIYSAAGEYVPQGTFRHRGADLMEPDRLRIMLDTDSVRENFDPKRLAYAGQRGAIRPGCFIALNFRRGRSVELSDCEAITLEDVQIFQSPGMGILESGGAAGHVYRGLRLIRRPGTRRVHYGTADHFHSNRAEKGAKILGCEFAHTSDDNINLHGNWSYVWGQVSPTVVVIGSPDTLEPGGRLTFYDRVELTAQGEAAILTVSPLKDAERLAEIEKAEVPQGRIAHRRNGQLVVVMLDRPVATAAHSLADPHKNHSAGFVIRDCYFHDSRSRGALLSGVRNGIVENNIWVNVLSGIDIYEESWGYAEGAIPAAITIKDNLIMDCGGVIPGGGITVGLVPGGRQGVRHTTPIRGIRILGNLLVNSGYLTILYTDGGQVKDNILIEPLQYMRFMNDYAAGSMLYGQAGYFPRARSAPISLWSSRNIEVQGNRVYLSGRNFPAGVVEAGDFTETIQTGQNTIVRMSGRGGMFEVNR